jgi:predicted RNA binding protein YcfA (HicA-like mRNA interferase family)
LIRALERAGFYIDRQSGSHAQLIHRDHPETRVTIPIHNRDLRIPMIRRILDQANLSVEEFRHLL